MYKTLSNKGKELGFHTQKEDSCDGLTATSTRLHRTTLPSSPARCQSLGNVWWQLVTYCLLRGKTDAVCVQVFQEGSVDRI